MFLQHTFNVEDITFDPKLIDSLTYEQQHMLCGFLEVEELKILRKLTKLDPIKAYIDDLLDKVEFQKDRLN